MRFCANCGFNISDIMVKQSSSKIQAPKPQPKKKVVKEPTEEELEVEPQEQDEMIKKIASKLIIKPNGDVKKRPSQKQDSHLIKAREARAAKQAEKKAMREQKPKEEPEPKASNEHNYTPQEPTGYVPLYSIF